MPGVEVIYRFSSSGALYKNEVGNSHAIQKEIMESGFSVRKLCVG